MNDPLFRVGEWVYKGNEVYRVMSREWDDHGVWFYRLRFCNEFVNEHRLVAEDVYNSPLWKALR